MVDPPRPVPLVRELAERADVAFARVAAERAAAVLRAVELRVLFAAVDFERAAAGFFAAVPLELREAVVDLLAAVERVAVDLRAAGLAVADFAVPNLELDAMCPPGVSA